jgi:SSS family solute:Na+ symporter
MTKPRDERELVGLVYSLTERPKDDGGVWYNRPMTLGIAVLLLTAALNFLFW